MEEQRKPTATEISEELRVLGKRLREAFIAARESQQSQEFRQELNRGLGELREELEELLESEEVQRLEESVRGAVREVSKGDVGQQIRKGVLAALRELNTRIESVIEEAEVAQSDDVSPPEEPSA